MAENEKITTISLNLQDAGVFRKLSVKTRIDLIELMHEIAVQVNTVLEDYLPESERINFMCDADMKNRMVHLRFSPLFFGGIPEVPQAEIDKLFDYKRDKFGKIHDLREEEELPDGTFKPKTEKAKA